MGVLWHPYATCFVSCASPPAWQDLLLPWCIFLKPAKGAFPPPRQHWLINGPPPTPPPCSVNLVMLLWALMLGLASWTSHQWCMDALQWRMYATLLTCWHQNAAPQLMAWIMVQRMLGGLLGRNVTERNVLVWHWLAGLRIWLTLN